MKGISGMGGSHQIVPSFLMPSLDRLYSSPNKSRVCVMAAGGEEVATYGVTERYVYT